MKDRTYKLISSSPGRGQSEEDYMDNPPSFELILSACDKVNDCLNIMYMLQGNNVDGTKINPHMCSASVGDVIEFDHPDSWGNNERNFWGVAPWGFVKMQFHNMQQWSKTESRERPWLVRDLHRLSEEQRVSHEDAGSRRRQKESDTDMEESK